VIGRAGRREPSQLFRVYDEAELPAGGGLCDRWSVDAGLDEDLSATAVEPGGPDLHTGACLDDLHTEELPRVPDPSEPAGCWGGPGGRGSSFAKGMLAVIVGAAVGLTVVVGVRSFSGALPSREGRSDEAPRPSLHQAAPGSADEHRSRHSVAGASVQAATGAVVVHAPPRAPERRAWPSAPRPRHSPALLAGRAAGGAPAAAAEVPSPQPAEAPEFGFEQ